MKEHVKTRVNSWKDEPHGKIMNLQWLITETRDRKQGWSPKAPESGEMSDCLGRAGVHTSWGKDNSQNHGNKQTNEEEKETKIIKLNRKSYSPHAASDQKKYCELQRTAPKIKQGMKVQVYTRISRHSIHNHLIQFTSCPFMRKRKMSLFRPF